MKGGGWRAFVLAAGSTLAFILCLRQSSSQRSSLGQSSAYIDAINGGGISMQADDLSSMLEKYRIERNVALAAIGHTSLTEIPTHSPKEEREHLKALKQEALQRLRSLSRGRDADQYGLKPEPDMDLSADDSKSEGPSQDGSSPCSASDARLGLCEDDSSAPPLTDAQQDLKDREEKVSEQLHEREKADDAERSKIEHEVDAVRLKKAEGILDKLAHTDKVINEVVDHTARLAGMAPHTPDASD